MRVALHAADGRVTTIDEVDIGSFEKEMAVFRFGLRVRPELVGQLAVRLEDMAITYDADKAAKFRELAKFIERSGGIDRIEWLG